MVWVHWGAEVGPHLAGGARISSKKLARDPRIGLDRLNLRRFGAEKVLRVGERSRSGDITLNKTFGPGRRVATRRFQREFARDSRGCEFKKVVILYFHEA